MGWGSREGWKESWEVERCKGAKGVGGREVEIEVGGGAEREGFGREGWGRGARAEVRGCSAVVQVGSVGIVLLERWVGRDARRGSGRAEPGPDVIELQRRSRGMSRRQRKRSRRRGRCRRKLAVSPFRGGEGRGDDGARGELVLMVSLVGRGGD